MLFPPITAGAIFFALSVWAVFWGPLLLQCLSRTREWRERKYYSTRTSHLSLQEIEVVYERCISRLRAYETSRRYARLTDSPYRKAKRRILLQQARRSLVLATVLHEHRMAAHKVAPGPTFLKSRRAILDQVSREAWTCPKHAH